MKFQRGTYGSVSFTYNGCTVRAFLPENETHGWCLTAGWSVYTGFKSRREAVEAVSRYL
jgi:hypothetical protein